jgi:8-oxo-dGTP pyrophosphatase MutT (NUDIX family)
VPRTGRQYLLHLRHANKPIRNPGYWSLPGGHPEGGESPHPAQLPLTAGIMLR